jgi:hypothetical protein
MSIFDKAKELAQQAAHGAEDNRYARACKRDVWREAGAGSRGSR